MAERLEDLNVPVAVVSRIVRETLPSSCNVAKEAKLALSRAATVFVLYLTSHANKISIAHGKKTVTNKDVMQAIQETEFAKFDKILIDTAEQFRKIQNNKKEALFIKKKTKEFQLGEKIFNEELEI